jgi:RND superfamily putative drug exporter
MLARLGRTAARHKWWFIGAWLVVLVGLGVLSSTVSHTTRDVFTIPGSESQEALNRLEADFPAFSGASADVVFQATSGKVTDSANQTAIESTVADLKKVRDVGNVVDPFETGVSKYYVSSDETIAYSSVRYSVSFGDLPSDAFDDLEKAAEPAVKAGLNVQYGGQVPDIQNPPAPGVSEYADEIGLALAALILLLSFGAVVAMGLPLGTALFALGTSMGILAIIEHWATIGTLNPTFGTMLGLGVGIDYSLLVLNRYLQNRAQGEDVATATSRSIATAGRAVIFAGLTVCIAVIALLVFGIPYLSVLGFTSAMFVAVTVVAALTLLPAFIGLAGRHIESIRLPFIRKRTEVDPDDPRSFWARVARFGARAPWVFGLVALLVLVILALPFRSAELGFVDDGDLPGDLTQKQAFDLLEEGFGPGANGPLLVVADLPGTSTSDEKIDLETLLGLSADIEKTHGVSTVTPPVPNSGDNTAVIIVTPDSGPSSSETSDLVRTLRDQTIPQAVKGSHLSASDVLVGGETAELIDFTARVEARLAVFIAVVLGLAFVILMLVFRSLLVPLKAVLLNLLMFLVVYGLLVAVFQWGWLKSIVGLDVTVPIEPFLPLVIFAVLFGLSTDYEVFLVTRIREEYDRTRDPDAAVVAGIGTTGRVVASAALIMASVFLSFVTNTQAVVKMVGFALGVGILLDAFVVRMVVVPSVLHVLGRSAWWFPRWLDRVLPTVELEGPRRSGAPDGPSS